MPSPPFMPAILMMSAALPVLLAQTLFVPSLSITLALAYGSSSGTFTVTCSGSTDLTCAI